MLTSTGSSNETYVSGSLGLRVFSDAVRSVDKVRPACGRTPPLRALNPCGNLQCLLLLTVFE